MQSITPFKSFAPPSPPLADADHDVKEEQIKAKLANYSLAAVKKAFKKLKRIGVTETLDGPRVVTRKDGKLRWVVLRKVHGRTYRAKDGRYWVVDMPEAIWDVVLE